MMLPNNSRSLLFSQTLAICVLFWATWEGLGADFTNTWLSVRNSSAYRFSNVIVAGKSFGEVGPGATSKPVAMPRQIYRYSPITLTSDGVDLSIMPVCYTGEKLLEHGHHTYNLSVATNFSLEASVAKDIDPPEVTTINYGSRWHVGQPGPKVRIRNLTDRDITEFHGLPFYKLTLPDGNISGYYHSGGTVLPGSYRINCGSSHFVWHGSLEYKEVRDGWFTASLTVRTNVFLWLDCDSSRR